MKTTKGLSEGKYWTNQGESEMRYHFDCKVEMIEGELRALEDTLRDEIRRVEQRLSLIDKTIEK